MNRPATVIPPERGPRLNALTGLRFIAAAGVLLYHMSAGGPGLAAAFGLDGIAVADLALGPNGVAFFFVLSGFILTHVYPELTSRGQVGRFLLVRFARLWPVHLLALALSMAVAGRVFWFDPEAVHHPLAVLGLHAAMLQSWVPSPVLTAAYNGPSWSVSAEAGFYLLFVPLIQNWAGSWWWKLPAALAVPVGLAVAANVGGWAWEPPHDRPSYQHALYFSPPARVWQFALGMATALLWRHLGPRLQYGPAVGTLVETAAVAGVLAAVWFAHPIGVAARDTPGLGMPAYHLLYGCSAVTAVPFAALVFVMAGGRGHLARLLASTPAVALGELSYAMYLLHWPLLDFLARHPEALDGVPGWQAAAAFVGILLTLSYWTHVCVERPARAWLVGLWSMPHRGPSTGRRGPVRGLALTAAVSAVAVAAVFWTTRATFRYMRPDQVESLVHTALPGSRDVRFGDAYLLRGAVVEPAAGGVRVRLVWQTLKPQPPGFTVWVQGVDPAPAEECVWAAVAAPDLGFGPKPTPAGLVWEQRVFVSRERLATAAQVVLIVLTRDETTFLAVSGGPLDHHGRLRLGLGTAEPPSGPREGER